MKFNKFLIMFCTGEWVWNDGQSKMDLDDYEYSEQGNVHSIYNIQEIYKDIKNIDRQFNFYYIQYVDITSNSGTCRDMLIKVKKKWAIKYEI